MIFKVGVITGGASGIGLETAKRLSATGRWKIHLLDVDDSERDAALKSIPGAVFHLVEVASFESQQKAFQAIFDKEGSIDFAYGNAGIAEHQCFYRTVAADGDSTPAPLDLGIVDINAKGPIWTTYLALHYMRLSPHKGKGSAIVLTGSAGGLYAAEFQPVYSASKAAVIQFVRSVAVPLHRQDGIRVFSVNPGTVRTNLTSPVAWEAFDQGAFTPIERVAEAVEMVVTGGEMVDSTGKRVAAGDDYGVTVEVHGSDGLYFRDQMPFADEHIQGIVEGLSMSNPEVAAMVSSQK